MGDGDRDPAAGEVEVTKPFEHPRWSDDAMAPIEVTDDEDDEAEDV